MAAFASSYIKTEASQVTRSADSASITGSNFSSWYRQDEGTVYCEATAVNNSVGDQRLLSIGANSSNNLQLFREFGSKRSWADVSISGTSVINNGTTGEWLAGTSRKLAFGFKSLDSALYSSTGTPATFTASLAFSTAYTTMNIGKAFAGGAVWNSHIKKIAYYPQRLSNTQLQALTKD